MQLLTLTRRFLALMVIALLAGCSKLVVLNPSGDIAAQQGQLIIVSTALMLLIIVPVIGLSLFFAWRYRAGSRHAQEKYAPDWHHSTKLELVIWSAPLMIIIALGAITWITTHRLDPYRPLARISEDKPMTAEVKPLEVQVVSLNWKWLFFYPEQGIAMVNEMAAPVDRPIRFKLTSENTMNAFYVPALAGMIYTMPGMQTQLNAVINQPGTYKGISAHYSGEGFSGMSFRFLGLSDEGFDQWVAQAKANGQTLTRQGYLDLTQPTSRDPVQRFAAVQPGLFQRVLNRCVEEGKPCMHEVMALDELRGRDRAVARAQQQSLCTAQDPYGYQQALNPLTTVQ